MTSEIESSVFADADPRIRQRIVCKFTCVYTPLPGPSEARALSHRRFPLCSGLQSPKGSSTLEPCAWTLSFFLLGMVILLRTVMIACPRYPVPLSDNQQRRFRRRLDTSASGEGGPCPGSPSEGRRQSLHEQTGQLQDASV